MTETCGVCRASHSCGLPPRHDGDHGCIDEDDNGEPHYTWARDDDHQYMVDLLRYHDGDFCDLCGPVDVTQYANPLLDHAMKAHPDLWAAEYAAEFPDYLGDGQWRPLHERPAKS